MRLPMPKQNLSWKLLITQLAEREYCQWASPYLAMLSRPLSVLALAGFSALLCGLFVAPQGFVVFAAIFAVIVIGCVWPWIGIRGITCQLKFATTRTDEGKPVKAELIITNRWPWPVWGLAVEGGFRPIGQVDEQATIAVSRVGGWARGSFRWTFVPKMRGHYPVSSPRIVTEFPFGIWKARKLVEVTSSLIVWPERFQLPPLAMPCGEKSWVGQPNECVQGNEGHRTSVREYRRGDSMRQIHWAKSAMYDTLVSYEREGLAIANATITLDTHPNLHSGIGPQSTLEWSIRIAASVCQTLLQQGLSVTLVSHATRFESQLQGNRPYALYDWLALLGSEESAARTIDKKLNSKPLPRALTLHVTTDLSGTTAGDSIVLLTGPENSLATNKRHPLRCWMVVKQGSDVASQIRRGWQSGPRSLHHAI